MGFKIKAADGTTLEVPDKEYYFNTKARGRRMMQNSLSSDARRVHACLELATMGWKQEECVIQERGEHGLVTRHLTPTDIKQQTGLVRSNVARGLKELDDAGLAERRAADGGALRKGQVVIYSWAFPREAKDPRLLSRAITIPDWFPESWEPIKSYISRNKYNLIQDEVIARDHIEEVAAAARAYKEAEEALARALEPVCAPPKNADASLYRKNRKILRERTSSSAVEPKVQAAKAEEDGSLYKKFKANYPEGHFDESEAKPIFEGKPKTEQLHILERLQVYLQCDRWKDDGGRWIKMASNWLQTYEADPPPRLNIQRNGRQSRSLDELVEFKQMQDEFDQNAKEINDALLNGRPLSNRQQELLDRMVGKT